MVIQEANKEQAQGQHQARFNTLTLDSQKQMRKTYTII
jgi:hypothetical protein